MPQRKYQTVLITGGSGFIGSNFVRYAYHAHPDWRIVNLDLLTYAGNPENLRDIEAFEDDKPAAQRRYTFVRGDVCGVALLYELFGQHHFDLVVHFAAESHVDRAIFSDVDFVRTNIEGTRALIEATRKNGGTRFVYISTDEVYGSIPDGYATEDTPFRPSNPYAASKAGADLLVQSYMKTHSLPAVIVRGSNNYGPYQYPEKLIPIAITNLIEDKKIPVHGTGEQSRSWLHVDDFCRAVDIAVHAALDYGIYNVAGEERTNLEVLELLARHLGKNLRDHREHINDRPGGDFRYASDASRIEQELGWSRRYAFEEGIQQVVRWYTDNQPWWQPIRLKKGFVEHYERQSNGQWC
ncbi:dTDP-glucose 4,6-dehydratase [Candidatus Parcubacteria bacterium]|nr:dTDP-glucose 4,6-dehydratase [Candidatus Parcubacteria bacterium]